MVVLIFMIFFTRFIFPVLNVCTQNGMGCVSMKSPHLLNLEV